MSLFPESVQYFKQYKFYIRLNDSESKYLRKTLNIINFTILVLKDNFFFNVLGNRLDVVKFIENNLRILTKFTFNICFKIAILRFHYDFILIFIQKIFYKGREKGSKKLNKTSINLFLLKSKIIMDSRNVCCKKHSLSWYIQTIYIGRIAIYYAIIFLTTTLFRGLFTWQKYICRTPLSNYSTQSEYQKRTKSKSKKIVYMHLSTSCKTASHKILNKVYYFNEINFFQCHPFVFAI